MKQVLKHLAAAVDEVFEQNCIANEMGALIDYGEWSQTAPDFKPLILEWKLTRQKLMAYIDEAVQLADLFHKHFPVKQSEWKWRKGVPYYEAPTLQDINPWHHVLENLHCIFMNDDLKPETQNA